MSTITLELDFWKRKALLDALNDHQTTWRGIIRDAEKGRRPGMSIEGAQMIFADLEDLITQVRRQSVE